MPRRTSGDDARPTGTLPVASSSLHQGSTRGACNVCLVPDATTFALFAVACVAFLVIPGPSVFYIVTRSLVQGRRAGVTSMFGVVGELRKKLTAIGMTTDVVSSTMWRK